MLSGVASIGLEGVKLVFLQVSPNIFSIFLYATRPNSLFGVGIAIATAALPLPGISFLENLLELVQFLAQLCERLLRGIGVFSAFLSGVEIGFLCSVLFETMTIASIVGRVRTPMLFAQVAMLLGTCFFRDSGTLSTRSLRTLLLAVRRFLVARRVGLVGSFLPTYALNSLERLKERTNVGRRTAFLVKVVLILTRVRTHSENVTC